MKLSDLPPELAHILKELGPDITRGAIYIDDALVHGTPPIDTGECWVPGESYERMRAFAEAPPPVLPRMPRK